MSITVNSCAGRVEIQKRGKMRFFFLFSSPSQKFSNTHKNWKNSTVDLHRLFILNILLDLLFHVAIYLPFPWTVIGLLLAETRPGPWGGDSQGNLVWKTMHWVQVMSRINLPMWWHWIIQVFPPKPLSSTEAKELALGNGGNTASRLLYPPQKQSLRLTLAWLSGPRSKFSPGTSEFMN